MPCNSPLELGVVLSAMDRAQPERAGMEAQCRRQIDNIDRHVAETSDSHALDCQAERSQIAQQPFLEHRFIETVSLRNAGIWCE